MKVVLTFLLAVACTLPANGQPVSCGNAPVSVMQKNASDVQGVCAGALDALAFFERLHLVPSQPLVVEIVTDLPRGVSGTAAGCYSEEEERILVLPWPAFEKRRDWFNVPIEPAMYRSLVAHEVAHAIADGHFSIDGPTIQAKEYIAYVAMFAVMERDLRARVLAANPGNGFDAVSQINALVYMLDPMFFGVEAYRHYCSSDNGAAFLLDVLAGEALTGDTGGLMQ